MSYQAIDGGVTAAKGFQASGLHCGIRKNQSKKDLALIVAQVPCRAAAVYAGSVPKTPAPLHTAAQKGNARPAAVGSAAGGFPPQLFIPPCTRRLRPMPSAAVPAAAAAAPHRGKTKRRRSAGASLGVVDAKGRDRALVILQAGDLVGDGAQTIQQQRVERSAFAV